MKGQVIWTIFYVAVSLITTPAEGERPISNKCYKVSALKCKNIQYNLTNVVPGEQGQSDLWISSFNQLHQSDCTDHLQHFLCSVKFPMCYPDKTKNIVVEICRSWCTNVKRSCEPYLVKFNYNWPKELECSQYPTGGMCMSPPPSKSTRRPLEISNIPLDVPPNLPVTKPPTATDTSSPSLKLAASVCSDRFVAIQKVSPDKFKCAPRCDVDVIFRQTDRVFTEYWMIAWAGVCFLSTLLTLLTFLIDTSRFKYPERPIIFLAFCYFCYSVGYIIRFIAGPDKIACEGEAALTDQASRNNSTVTSNIVSSFIVTQGINNPWCIVVFLITYYFGMAAALWWVVLSLTWYLSAASKWGGESIDAVSSYFHLVAWALPAILTICILIMRQVDGDELTRMCYVGNQNSEMMTGFVLAPLVVFLIAGAFFTLAGFCSLFGIRRNLRSDGHRAVGGHGEAGAAAAAVGGGTADLRRLEKLIAKIGIFSVLYALPMTCIVGCLFYEQREKGAWKKRVDKGGDMANCNRDCSSESNNNCKNKCDLVKSVPVIEVFLLKIFMTLIIGTTSGMWIWTYKSIDAWKRFFRCKTVPSNKQPTSAPLVLPASVPGGVSGAGRLGSTGAAGRHGPHAHHMVMYKAVGDRTSPNSHLLPQQQPCALNMYDVPVCSAAGAVGGLSHNRHNLNGAVC